MVPELLSAVATPMFSEAAQFEPSLCPSLSRDSVRIGDVSVSVSGLSSEDTQMDAGLQSFRREMGQPDVEICVEWVDKLRPRSSPVFDSGALWSIFPDEQGFSIDFFSRSVSNGPYKQLQVDGEFCNARLLLSREALDAHRPIFPLEYPADELLITNYMATHALGVEVHGCGLVDSETGGHLFLGHSGAGKSTTARLWQGLRNPEILSDDRLILRIENGALWMHGTPWHGEGRFASPGKCRIDKILILQHGQENQVVPLSPSRAAGELFARCFPPFHSSPGLQRTIEFLDRVVSIVACSEFRFAPDKHAVQAVLEMS
jgi:hypothetical protein